MSGKAALNDQLLLPTPAGALTARALGSASSDRCFVCVHGATERASEEWALAGKAMAAAGCSVILLDMPGYGASAASAPTRLPTKSELYAADSGAADVVWAAACGAAAQLGSRSVVLCGASMGGGQVLSAVLKHGCKAKSGPTLGGIILWYPSFKEQPDSSLGGLARARVPVMQAWAKDDPMHPPAKTIFTSKWGDGSAALAKGVGATTHVFRKTAAFHSADAEAIVATVAFATSLALDSGTTATGSGDCK